ncbi:putative peptidase [Escherichia coli]|uniref:Putative peptidase n=1 Tax=Escherichia coli TaxID=562 RepID=A0A377K2M4_ECOLX|nr:putative peptidase [Escherichia coli]
MLQLNLANAYLQGGQPQEAANILNRYTFNNKDDSNGWDLLAQAEAALNNRDQELAARAEGYALAGRLDQAISLLSSASFSGEIRQPATSALRCAHRPVAPAAGTL